MAMAYYMESVNVTADHYPRTVVDGGQKPDAVPVGYYQPVQPMKRPPVDPMIDPGQKPDTVPVGYYAPPAQVKRVDDTLEGVEVADPTGTELCAAPTANDVPVNVQAASVAAAVPVDPAEQGVAPGVVPPQVQKPKLTVGATQLTMEQKITFARLAIAWKGQGRPMREFDALMKSAGYQVSPSSLSQWMKLPDATGVMPPPRKRRDRDSSRRKFVRQWMPKI